MVAGMCVMQDGVIKKNLSRRFKIKTVYGQMIQSVWKKLSLEDYDILSKIQMVDLENFLMSNLQMVVLPKYEQQNKQLKMC